MERAVMRLAWLSLSVVLLLSLLYPGAQAARLSLWHPGAQSARVLGELPPCKDVWGGIPGWDCFDPPTHDLPACDFHHQRAGIDCWPKSSPKAPASSLLMDHDASPRVQGALPSCNDFPGGIPNWDCFDPPRTPLPPCNFKHQNPGIDCSTDSQTPRPPPAPKAAMFSSTQDLDAAASQKELPPCKDVPGGIQNWDCYDPPSTPLPPCDDRHIDCDTRSLKPPPAPKAQQGATDITELLSGSSN